MLSNKKLVFGITGGIAAYKTAELLRGMRVFLTIWPTSSLAGMRTPS